ncbi:MAG: glycosyltransferase [Acidaminococcales bacterium]|jgi:glycosyltransferase involved in cell wall biosynthesis|nr:glycosyltransferase [Acidaminococcales bacterium]
MSGFAWQKGILNIAQALKPLLRAAFPASLLRTLKRRLVFSVYAKFEQVKIQPFDRAAYPDGVNLIGDIKGETGLGESCRLLAGALAECAWPALAHHYRPAGALKNSDCSWDGKAQYAIKHNINLLHINPHELPLAFLKLGADKWHKRYNIAFWLWEMADFPAEWLPAFRLLDEIWTPTEFVSASIRQKTALPVVTMPYYLPAPETDAKYGRKHFGLPEGKTLFLLMFDSLSITARKNPLGGIAAFKQAFGRKRRDVGLVVKINHPQPTELAQIKSLLAGYGNVYIIAGTLPKIAVNSLIKCSDAFVSLHRSEGFGLVMAEAMLLKTPVVATNWSANTEFMDSDVACMVDFSLVKVGRDIWPYKKNDRWAEPDIGQAAAYMRKLHENENFRARIRQNAYAHIAAKFSRGGAAKAINNRIAEIYASRAPAGYGFGRPYGESPGGARQKRQRGQG